jgi:hypothetical protein
MHRGAGIGHNNPVRCSNRDEWLRRRVNEPRLSVSVSGDTPILYWLSIEAESMRRRAMLTGLQCRAL